ncbi:MAG TPA: DUF4384 domain-containing protein [Burkholderiaceae bacterium]|nr:DUF4384 domain-containing protein [Burkholderiaceae bacterium]
MKSVGSLRTTGGAAARAGAAVAVTVAALAGCSSLEPGRPVANASAPATAPATASLADFSAGLRCMDTLLLDYGVRDVSVMVEDLVDKGQPVNAGTKDMLVSVVSDMTQRSRAIRLVASGKEWGNTVNHLSQALQREPLAVIPQYALRGSISRQETTVSSTVSVDLTMLSTRDFSVVPGIAARNSIALSRSGRGFDGRGEIRKFGVSFNLRLSADEASAQGLRALLELAAIELFGRLAKVPYWTCLGLNDAHEGIAAEMQGWYDALAAHPTEVIKHFQQQLRTRRVYNGPIDGAVNPQFKEAVARYREVLGLAREPKLSLEFFKAYLSADHHQLAARVRPAAATPVSPAATAAAPTQSAPTAPAAMPSGAASVPAIAAAAAGAAPLALHIATANEKRGFARGEAVHLTVWPNRDAHVYCFLQNEQRKIMRFFPNRFERDSRVLPAEGLRLPGKMRFEIFMNRQGMPETVACFATEQDVLADLPADLNAGDFAALPVATLEQVRGAFAEASKGVFAQDVFQIRLRDAPSDLHTETRQVAP